MSTLSVCVVTKNEAHNIYDCLNSVAWADEIIVIDSCSTDQTVEICKQFTDKITIMPWQGCGPQKQAVFSMATSEWVLMLDADERISPELAREIQSTLLKPKHQGYSIPFKSYYCGKQIRFGDWKNERHLRLLHRASSKIIPNLIHFGIEVKGSCGMLKNYISHYSFPDLNTVINKMHSYSTAGAVQKFQQGKTTSIWSAIGHALFTFMRGYIFKLGFLDGHQGFMLAISNAEGAYYKYAKLLELQTKYPRHVQLDLKTGLPLTA